MPDYRSKPSSKLPYLGQCDRIRRNNPEGESFWQEMIANAEPVSAEELEAACDVSAILDEDESLEDFVNPNDHGYFRSTVQGKPVWYVQTAGFEFVFADSVTKALTASDHSVYTDESGKFWGAQGAGAVFVAEDTGRVLLQHRSKYVNEPGTWGREVVVIEAGEQKLDIVQDFIDVVTSMCARIYGQRAAKNRARRALDAAGRDA